MPITLWLYIGKRFIITFSITVLLIAAIIALFDALELFRIMPHNVGTLDVLSMSLLKNYNRLERAMPFLIMLSSMLTYANLNKHSELVICRSSGLSVWQFIAPSMIAAFIFGIMVLLFINPIGTFFYAHYEHMQAVKTHNYNTPISFSRNGIWLQQTDKASNEKTILHALYIVPEQKAILKVLIFVVDADGNFIKRIDANEATYEGHTLLIPNAQVTLPLLKQYFEKNISIEIDTPLSGIAENIIDPAAISFLQLRSLIQSVKAAGFPVLKHQMQFYKMLLMPLLYAVMVMVGICFTTRMERLGKTAAIQFLGVLIGFIIYFFSDIFYALGAAGSFSIWFAACLPILLCATASGYYLLHREDG